MLFLIFFIIIFILVLITKFWIKITGVTSSILQNYQLNDIIECQNTKGVIIKKKIGAMHEKIRELFRVFSAIMEDELLIL